jgi:CBS domain-containing protein
MHVRDVMVERFEAVAPDAPIWKAAGLLREGPGRGEGGMPALLVMEGDRLSGIVTLSDLLKAILPPYIAQDPHLMHMAWEGLLETQFKRVRAKPVREIMTTAVVTVREEAVLTEAAEIFFSHHVHSLPVVKDGKVVGMLYLSDLASHVFERLVGHHP